MKLYDVHIKYENGMEYSKYGLRFKDLKFNTIHSLEFDMESTTSIEEFKIVISPLQKPQKNLTNKRIGDTI